MDPKQTPTPNHTDLPETLTKFAYLVHEIMYLQNEVGCRSGRPGFFNKYCDELLRRYDNFREVYNKISLEDLSDDIQTKKESLGNTCKLTYTELGKKLVADVKMKRTIRNIEEVLKLKGQIPQIPPFFNIQDFPEDVAAIFSAGNFYPQR